MAYIEKATDLHEPGPELFPVSLELEADAHELLVELMQRTGWSASELVGWALGAQWREMEGIVLPPLEPQEGIEQVLRESEDDVRAGRTSSHEDVMAEARKILGG